MREWLQKHRLMELSLALLLLPLLATSGIGVR